MQFFLKCAYIQFSGDYMETNTYTNITQKAQVTKPTKAWWLRISSLCFTKGLCNTEIASPLTYPSVVSKCLYNEQLIIRIAPFTDRQYLQLIVTIVLLRRLKSKQNLIMWCKRVATSNHLIVLFMHTRFCCINNCSLNLGYLDYDSHMLITIFALCWLSVSMLDH